MDQACTSWLIGAFSTVALQLAVAGLANYVPARTAAALDPYEGVARGAPPHRDRRACSLGW